MNGALWWRIVERIKEYIIHANIRMRDNVALALPCGHDKLISDPLFPRHRRFVSSCDFPREQKRLKLSKMCLSSLVDIRFYLGNIRKYYDDVFEHRRCFITRACSNSWYYNLNGNQNNLVLFNYVAWDATVTNYFHHENCLWDETRKRITNSSCFHRVIIYYVNELIITIARYSGVATCEDIYIYFV